MHKRSLAAALLANLCLCGLAQGQSPASNAGWQFAAAPYVWAAGIKGDLATLPPLSAAAVDASFSDILNNLGFAFMMLAEARNDRFVALLDLSVTRLNIKAETPGPLFSGVTLNSTSAFVSLTGGYRIVSEAAGFIEPFVGGRLWYVDSKIKLKAGVANARSGSETEAWVDPILGVRARLNLGSGIFLSGYFDLGGFGVGSDLTWQAYGGAGYEFSSRWSAFAGYRYLSVDYKKGGYVYDIRQYGPMLGAAYRF
jgi:opacity protein-like surface antigen